ncbi:MAG: hypothetical protein HC893_11225 [Chloroflexaceae bacterium]|nr:hypothetical protein [Chloroflexaceae bacterium]
MSANSCRHLDPDDRVIVALSFTLARRESALLEAILLTHTDTDNYSRDLMPSTNWPGFAPGTRGVNNAISPRYCNLSALATITPRPPICWIRGDQDQVVADQALSDVGTLGAMGLIPGWPGVMFSRRSRWYRSYGPCCNATAPMGAPIRSIFWRAPDICPSWMTSPLLWACGCLSSVPSMGASGLLQQ